jgi:hypothetical protein
MHCTTCQSRLRACHSNHTSHSRDLRRNHGHRPSCATASWAHALKAAHAEGREASVNATTPSWSLVIAHVRVTIRQPKATTATAAKFVHRNRLPGAVTQLDMGIVPSFLMHYVQMEAAMRTKFALHNNSQHAYKDVLQLFCTFPTGDCSCTRAEYHSIQQHHDTHLSARGCTSSSRQPNIQPSVARTRDCSCS